ncbi:MAG: peptidoglycan editing factor PgeF [Nitrospirae bacterium]|uniref:peptidoglycan editing factor PgeF n=1 Tax=Candidatus Magnetobacterium casense TaxID=1455061 RepID=UPI000ADC7E99|nr:peptidoglycan editing factor PgeF [Candidatus Magnetobacterium casensis]MBF0337576.1 peptidoglycan editing factor PgeF [Nitrospirota bacterium]
MDLLQWGSEGGTEPPPFFLGNQVKALFTDKNVGIDRASICALFEREVDFYMPTQRHTDLAITILRDQSLTPEGCVADAVITNRPGVVIGVQTADCVPILAFDPHRHVIAAIHAGWRGTAKGILKTVIATMRTDFSCNPREILIAVGPSIKSCCYEVGGDVMYEVRQTTGAGDYIRQEGDKWYVDLARANLHQALAVGLAETNVWISPDCTFCMPELYHSYRRTKAGTGRQGGFIGML